MPKPNLAALWVAFPDHDRYPTLKDLYTWLAGVAEKNINVQGFGPRGNTCASRLSVAFNRGGYPINAAIASKTIGTANGSRIIFNVAVFRQYLLATLGKPTLDKASPFDDSFRGKKGIIAFSVNWPDATGHIALFNGVSYREPRHDDYARFISNVDPRIRIRSGEFWELA